MLIGHQRIWQFLIQSAAKNRLAHAYLFTGSSQIGKKTLALEFVKWLLCEKTKSSPALLLQRRGHIEGCGQCPSCLNIAKNQHPDVLLISPRQEEKKGVVKTFEIGIDEIKALQHQLSLFPYSAKYKVAIIDEAASMTREAANSFLKTLEEPGHNALIILVSSAWQYLLPTIISRCQLIKFLPVPEKDLVSGLERLGKKSVEISRVARLAANRPGLAIKLLDEPDAFAGQQENIEVFKKVLKVDLAERWDLARQMSQNSVTAHEALSQWIFWLRDRLLEASGCDELTIGYRSGKNSGYSVKNLANLIKEIQQTQNIISNSSFNARLALEVLMLKI